MNTKQGEAFLRLVGIMDDLREKCPWDRQQTIQTLRQLTIEETYELADAITDEDWKGIKEELGDLLLHVLFYSKIGSEQKQFELEDMINHICEKLISRHPHIYGDPAQGGEKIIVSGEEEVKKNWENLKLKEGKTSVLSGVPKALPSMVKAMRLQEKAKQVGFEWQTKEQVWEKVEEEIGELKSAIASRQVATENNQSGMGGEPMESATRAVEEEFGDLIFSLINYARFLRLDAENALELTNKKFIRRFTQMEEQVLKNGKNLDQISLQEMDAIWNIIKMERET